MWEGFAYAAGAAVGHSCIDASRKLASQRFTPEELVGLVGLLDAVFLAAILFLTGESNPFMFHRMDTEFLVVLFVTAAIKIVVGFMYQRALHVSPLSATVPYLAFSPVLLVFTSYLLINEMPSAQGLLGVVIVTMGGYFLALDHPELKKEKAPKLHSFYSTLQSFLPWMVSDKITKTVEQGKVDVSVVIDDHEEKPTQASKLNWPPSEWNPCFALRKEEGSLLMLGVAALLSISNTLDKIGSHMAPSFLVFATIQRTAMAIPVVLYLLFTSPKSLRHLIHHFPLMASISLFEIGAFICYLKSLEMLLVAYSVAAKRSNVLLSVVIARVIFKEKIWRRLPFILMMVGGMTMILFA